MRKLLDSSHHPFGSGKYEIKVPNQKKYIGSNNNKEEEEMLQLVGQVVLGVWAEPNRALRARPLEGVAIATAITSHAKGGHWGKLKETAEVTHLQDSIEDWSVALR